jgi:hypothetical protein
MPKFAFLLFNDQPARTRQHQKPLLNAFGVIERVRVPRPQDRDVDTRGCEWMFAGFERIRRPSLLLVPHRKRVAEAENKPSVGVT